MVKNIKHIAIISDGNGRWAKARGLSRSEGHKAGEKTFVQLCQDVSELGISYLTIYGFSTENWSRSEQEVSALIALFTKYIEYYSTLAEASNYRFRVLGGRENISAELCDAIESLEEKTSNNTGLNVQIAFNYGGRDELLRAVKKMMVEGNEASEFSMDDLENSLDTHGIPDPDIIIRTGGEQRLSNFLLWQCAYSELFFIEKYWPDFSKDDLVKVIDNFNQRTRKFGGVNE